MKKKLLIFTVLMTMAFAVACADEGDYYDGFKTAEDLEGEKGEPVPAGGKYTKSSTGKVIFEGENMPETAADGDVYEQGDYVYTMMAEGWTVTLNKTVDKTRDSFNDIIDTIANCPIINITDLYKGCTGLLKSPKIPDSVKVMDHAFDGCTALTEAPALPANVESIQYTFYDCKSITAGPTIPNTVKDLKYTFYGCSSLKEAPAIPDNITNIIYAFNGCSSLTKAPKMPPKLKIMGYAFCDCTSLVEAPEVPETVTDMAGVFKNCTSLVKGPRIPANVKYLSDTFNSCTSLTGTLVIDGTASDNAGCFRLVNFKAQGLEVTGAATNIDKLLRTGIME